MRRFHFSVYYVRVQPSAAAHLLPSPMCLPSPSSPQDQNKNNFFSLTESFWPCFFSPPPNSDSFPGWRFLLARIWQPMQSLNHLGRVLCIIYFLSHKNLNKHETIKCRLSWENTAEQVICHWRHVISHDMTFRWKEDHLFCGKAVGCKSSISCCCFWRENTCSGIFLTSKMSKQKIQRWIIKRGREQRNSYWRLRRSSAFWRIWL